MQKLPIGIQSFRRIRTEDYLYVDKTEEIYHFLQAADYALCCRPSRFGKSLLLSTIEALYQGKKELFQGLWIENQWRWEKQPVIYLDFNRLDFLNNSLEKSLSREVYQIAKSFDIDLNQEDTAKKNLEILIESLSKKEGQVILLIDDYGKALTDFMRDAEQRKWHAQLLQNFYGCLKSLDAHLQKVILMGSSKHGANQIFADFDGLRDLSHAAVAAKLCGFSSEELQSDFSPQIAALSRKAGLAVSSLTAKIRFWYSGYSWDGKHKVCNPFSVLNFFADKMFHNYWHEMFTSQNLLRSLEDQKILPYELESFESDGLLLKNDEIELPNSLAMLFQSGQLSIKEIQQKGLNDPSYRIGFPNQEVRISFMQHLLAEYTDLALAIANHRYSRPLKKSIEAEDWEGVIQVFNQLLKAVPRHLFNQDAQYFYSVLYVLLGTTAWVEFAEIQQDLSRMDLLLRNQSHSILFEFNIDGSAKEAVTQIRMMQYPERYAHVAQKTVLFGISYNPKQDQISDWVSETLAKKL